MKESALEILEESASRRRQDNTPIHPFSSGASDDHFQQAQLFTLAGRGDSY
jgi:hypothetical protein